MDRPNQREERKPDAYCAQYFLSGQSVRPCTLLFRTSLNPLTGSRRFDEMPVVLATSVAIRPATATGQIEDRMTQTSKAGRLRLLILAPGPI